MGKREKLSPTESEMLFEIDPEPAPESLTALGGMPLAVQAFRSLGLPGSVKRHVQVKERERGYDEATLVESFMVLHAAGGECVDDFQRLREDPGLEQLIGHEMPSPSAALQFLYQFHDEEKIAEAQQRRAPKQEAYIPEETGARRIWGIKSCRRFYLIGASLPEILKAATEFTAAEGDDGVGPMDRPVHASTLQPGADPHFTPCFHHAGRRA